MQSLQIRLKLTIINHEDEVDDNDYEGEKNFSQRKVILISGETQIKII